MSEETKQFKDIRGFRGLRLQSRFEGNLAITAYSLLVAGIGGLFSLWSIFRHGVERSLTPVLVTAAGAIGVGWAMISEHMRIKDSQDFMGAKLGLIPIEDIGKHRLHLSKQEKKEMTEIFDRAADRRYNAWKAAGFPGGADMSTKHLLEEERKDEQELNEARTEWKKRIEARKQSAHPEASK